MNIALEKETIGSRIKKVRVNQNITIGELSKLTEISEVLLVEYEGGLKDPMSREIARISIALNVTSDYILGHIEKETNDMIILNRYKIDGLFIHNHGYNSL